MSCSSSWSCSSEKAGKYYTMSHKPGARRAAFSVPGCHSFPDLAKLSVYFYHTWSLDTKYPALCQSGEQTAWCYTTLEKQPSRWSHQESLKRVGHRWAVSLEHNALLSGDTILGAKSNGGPDFPCQPLHFSCLKGNIFVISVRWWAWPLCTWGFFRNDFVLYLHHSAPLGVWLLSRLHLESSFSQSRSRT